MHLRHLVAGLLVAGLASQASAAVDFTLSEVGSDLVLTVSGSANRASLFPMPGGALVSPSLQDTFFVTGAAGTQIGGYGFISGPTSLGTLTNLTSGVGSGDLAGVAIGSRVLMLPLSYVSGTPLSGSTTFANASFSSIGLTAGSTFTWTWGSGPTADSATLTIALPTVSPVPEPGTWALMAAGLGALAVGARRRRRTG